MKYPNNYFLGKKFGYLTVNKLSYTSDSGHRYFECRCDCGIVRDYRYDGLVSGAVQSCGCFNKKRIHETHKKNIIGNIYGSLTVQKEIRIGKKLGWECKCKCGNIVKAITTNLTRTKGGVKSCGCTQQPDLTGKKFGKLTVLTKGDMHKNRERWVCSCECGKETRVARSKLNSGHTKTCGCSRHISGSKNKSWKGTEFVSSRYFNEVKSGSKNRVRNSRCGRTIPFDITIEYVDSIFRKQNGKCALSGVDIEIKPEGGTASLDRIDSSKGYIEGNVQWVHREINRIKWEFSDEKFINWCRIVTDFQNKK